MRKTLKDKMARNTEFYTTTEIKPEDVPLINSRVFRFESFGELQNLTQLKNYCTIAWENEHCTFSVWSKNIELLAEAYDKNVIFPNNLNIIASSRRINQNDYKYYIELCEGMRLFDAIFTVYTPDYAEQHGIEINCGYRKCIDCMKCYQPELHMQKTLFINELLK